MIFAGIYDVLDASQWHFRIDKVRVAPDELVPLKVLGHGDWSFAQLLYSLIGIVTLASENAGERIVAFLNLANHNLFELTPRGLQV